MRSVSLGLTTLTRKQKQCQDQGTFECGCTLSMSPDLPSIKLPQLSDEKIRA